MQERKEDKFLRAPGAEEARVEPLSKKSLELIPDIARLLRVVNINFALYPRESPTLQSPIDQMFKKLTDIFTRDEILVFSEVKDTLVVNGKLYISLVAKDAFLSLLKSHHIESLTFKKGLAKKELVAFIECLHIDSEAMSLLSLLKSKEVVNIIINEISYEISQGAKRTQEREKLEEAMLLDYLLGKLSSDGRVNFLEKLERSPEEIAEAISKLGDMVAKEDNDKFDNKEVKADIVAKSVWKIASQIIQKDPQDWERHKKNLAKTILNLDPKLRKDVLLMESKAGIGQHEDIIKELIPELPDDVVIDLLTDELTKTKASSAKMRGLVQRLLVDPAQRDKFLPLLKERLTNSGIAEGNIPWMIGEKNWKDLNLDERVDEFSKMTTHDFLGLAEEIDIKSLIQETFKENRSDLLKIILDKLKEFFRIEAPEVKSEIDKIFSGLVDSIHSSKDEAFVNLIDFLFNEFRDVKDLDIYSLLISYLVKPAIDLIDNNNFIAAQKIISKLAKENSLDNLPVTQKRYIQEALDKFTEPARLKELVAEFIKRIDEDTYHEDIENFIIELNNPGLIKMLIDEAMIEDKVLSSLGYFAAFIRRRAIGMILGKIIRGKARKIINKELIQRLSDNRSYIIRNTIELFVFINDPLQARFLEASLRSEDMGIRSKAIFALGRLGGKESIELLIKALKDKEKSIRLKALKVLGKIGEESAIKELKNYASDKTIGTEVAESIRDIEKRIKDKKES